jgi:hypothetical protein
VLLERPAPRAAVRNTLKEQTDPPTEQRCGSVRGRRTEVEALANLAPLDAGVSPQRRFTARCMKSLSGGAFQIGRAPSEATPLRSRGDAGRGSCPRESIPRNATVFPRRAKNCGRSPNRWRSCPTSGDSLPRHSSTTTRSMRFTSGPRVTPTSDVAYRTTLAIIHHQFFRPYETASLAAFTGRALMIFRAGFALNTVGSFVNGLMPLRAFVAGFLMTTNFANPGTKKAPVF